MRRGGGWCAAWTFIAGPRPWRYIDWEITSSPYLAKATRCPSGSNAKRRDHTGDPEIGSGPSPRRARRGRARRCRRRMISMASGSRPCSSALARITAMSSASSSWEPSAREESVAESAGPAGGHLGVATDVDRDVGLGGAGSGVGVGEPRELAVGRGRALGPERPQRGDVVVEALAPLGEGDAEGVELLLEPPDADAELDPAAGEPVEGGDLLGDHDRVALREDQDAGAESDRATCGRPRR